MFMPTSTVQVLVSVFALAHCALALSTWNVSSSEFVRMIWMSTIVVGDYLYIDAGEYYLPGASSWADTIHLNSTLSIDLSNSWTTTSVTINSFGKPAGLKGTRDGALWWDRNSSRIISFGGEPFSEIPLYVWALTPDGNGAGSWSELYGPDDSLWKTLVRPEYGLIAASPETGYFMGGMVTKWPEDLYWAIPGMITFDFASSRWTNLTSVGLYSASGMALGGSAQFVPPFGEAGLIIMMGGVVPSSSWDTGGSFRPMSNITIFDPHHQNSTDVYILTLPAFHWIRVTGSAPPRAGSHCQIVGNRQMLSVGGYDPTSSAEYATADPWTYGLGIFDMTDLSWGTHYNANAMPYVRSDAVNDYYAKQMNTATTGSTAKNSTTPTSNAPAIAGGVVGGIAALAVALLAFWWCSKKRKASQPHASEPYTTEPYTTEPQYIYELGGTKPAELEARDKPIEIGVS
ncbi:hypothetical protein FGG08_007004 [Glutinoglossum americanum]|uniref:Kelch repeat protein n=1 Tax=Glutinoglossum americanum TaxID=1670608 RepID=A0A9P8HV53_9PEZI|nr:hypothetical protein FGG08_007004 [Glutinoglossum americanum]